MSQDWWFGVIVGGLTMTFIWAAAGLVVIAAIGSTHHQDMDGHKWTGPGSDADD